MRREIAIVAVAAMILAACEHQPSASATAEVASTPAAPAEPVLLLPDGSAVNLEIAASPETRGQGLMFRESILPGRGMLFIFPEPAANGFWMKNTLIPLDMIWIDAAGTVVALHQNVPPCKADPCPTYDPGTAGSYVLELAGGEAAKHGVVVGSKIRLPDLSAVIVR